MGKTAREKVLSSLNSAALGHLRMVFHDLFSFVQLGERQATEKKKILRVRDAAKLDLSWRKKHHLLFYSDSAFLCSSISKLKCSFHLKEIKYSSLLKPLQWQRYKLGQNSAHRVLMKDSLKRRSLLASQHTEK